MSYAYVSDGFLKLILRNEILHGFVLCLHEVLAKQKTPRHRIEGGEEGIVCSNITFLLKKIRLLNKNVHVLLCTLRMHDRN